MQRIRRFASFDQILRSDRDTLVCEFLDVSTAPDHEFLNELERQRYARYIHAVGCLQYGSKFLDELESVYTSGVVKRPDFPVGEAA
jgi:hypothetical protein